MACIQEKALAIIHTLQALVVAVIKTKYTKLLPPPPPLLPPPPPPFCLIHAIGIATKGPNLVHSMLRQLGPRRIQVKFDNIIIKI